MRQNYPSRLSVAELRVELAAYLEYRRTTTVNAKVAAPTIQADRSHISQFLDWLETGRTSRYDIDALAAQFSEE